VGGWLLPSFAARCQEPGLASDAVHLKICSNRQDMV
jgi:hypothetical protein